MKSLFIIISSFVCLQTLLFGELPKDLTLAQSKAWQEMENYVEELRDSIGMPVDQGIKKLVIALNLLNYPTTQSCEGHLYHGRSYPWVSLIPDPTRLEEWMNLQQAKDALHDELKVLEEEMLKLEDKIPLYEKEERNIQCARKRQEIWKVWEEIMEAEKNLYAPIWDLLREFYIEDTSITLTTLIMDKASLIPIGGLCQERYSKESQQENLKAFREEMDKFAEFIIQKFRES